MFPTDIPVLFFNPDKFFIELRRCPDHAALVSRDRDSELI